MLCFMYVLRVLFCDSFTHCICAANKMLYKAAIYCGFQHSRSPPSSPEHRIAILSEDKLS